jgi:hypothetical protein
LLREKQYESAGDKAYCNGKEEMIAQQSKREDEKRRSTGTGSVHVLET